MGDAHSLRYLPFKDAKNSRASLFTHHNHREGVANSDRVLQLKGPLKFDLEAVTGLPTKDQTNCSVCRVCGCVGPVRLEYVKYTCTF